MTKIMTSFANLMSLAHELGQARLSGDEQRIKEAEEAHETYRQMCLESDGMTLDLSSKDIETKLPTK